MADVMLPNRSPPTGRFPTHATRTERAERAQLLLITALALAVILVTVALLLNAAIFTENIATRDTTADGPEALELRGEIVGSVGDLIERENYGGSGNPAAVQDGVEAMGPMADRERARSGVLATVRHDTHDTGNLLRWDTSGDPRPLSELGTNWTLVDNLGNAREYRLVFDPTTLNSSTAESSDEVLGVRFNSSTDDDVTLHIYDDEDAPGHLAVSRAVEGETPQRQCRIEYDGPTTVDITGDQLSTDDATVECFRGLWPDNNPKKIEYINIENEEAAFAVTIDGGDSIPSEVEVTDAVYSVTVDIGYQSQDLTFETTARVAPGEPR